MIPLELGSLSIDEGTDEASSSHVNESNRRPGN